MNIKQESDKNKRNYRKNRYTTTHSMEWKKKSWNGGKIKKEVLVEIAEEEDKKEKEWTDFIQSARSTIAEAQW